MKQTLAISSFAGMLAGQSGYTADFCERFVVEMFKTVADALKESDNVTVKGLGSFSVDADGNVNFIADTTFAADINAPFECFEPEPLEDGVTDIMLEDAADAQSGNDQQADEISSSEAGNDNNAEPEVEVSEKPIETVTTEIETETPSESTCSINENDEDISNAEPIPDAGETTEESIEDEPINEQSSDETSTDTLVDENKETDYSEEERELPRRRPVWAFITGVALGTVIGAAATYFIIANPFRNAPIEPVIDSEQTVAKEFGEAPDVSPIQPTEQSDKAIELENQPDSQTENQLDIQNENITPPAPENPATSSDSETVVYDTVKSTLAQLSRKHYGRYEFWVYIYEENRDIISDPDRVEPDTRLRIPAPEKYGIDARDKVSVNEALKKAREISLEKK